MIYVVVLMLIFGALGVIMVSMFTSSTASTVTKNDTRRATYMAESGMRYGFSELRNVGLRERGDENDYIINTLNKTTYTVTDAGSFTINVFTPWLQAYETQSWPTDKPLKLVAPLGTIPSGFIGIPAVPLNNIYLVNLEFVGDAPTASGSSAEIDKIDGLAPTFDLSLKDDFNVRKRNIGPRIYRDNIGIAVKPTQDWTIADGGSGNLYIAPEAMGLFPRFDGAIKIRSNNLFYEKSIYDPINNRVELTNIVAKGGKNLQSSLPMDVTTSDFVILSIQNYTVIPTGKSGNVEYGGDYAFGNNLAWLDHRVMSSPPDITAEDLTSNLSQQESDTRFFEVDTVTNELQVGGGTSDEFGSALFEGNLNIGGDQDYCQQGACLFASGVRVFFLLNFNQQGDGITFTLLSKGFPPPAIPNNSASSVGGDFQLSETMGYAGDSRLDTAGTVFLATNSDDRGLDPPKIAVEFDTRTNNTAGDPPPDYCTGANANTDTRNDPLTANKDAVQYVFWGRTSFLNIPCRNNNPLYDDNRHDAYGEQPKEEWQFGAGGTFSFWRPAIGSDGTIYMSARDATLYALNEDGTIKWTFNLGDNNEYMPGIDTKGTADPNDDVIYSDIAGNSIVAIDSAGNELWRFGVNSDIDSTPTVGPDGRVYFGTDFEQSLFAMDPGARAAGQPFPDLPAGEWQRPTLGQVDGVAALSPDASVVYFVADAPDNNLYAVNTADGSVRWKFPLLADTDELNSSPVVNPADGTIYVGSDNHNVYGINPNGTEKWRFTTGADVESSPVLAVDPVDGIPTVYIGSDDDKVYALNANTGAKKWEFLTGGPNVTSSPIVDLDGTIYVGSEDGNVYAINPNGTQKWFFPTGDQVQSSPAIGKAGYVHIGSNNTNFYTISQFADPRNFKDEDKSLGKLLTFEDLDSSVSVDNNTDWLNGASSKGSWAVRLEVDRGLLPNADGEFEYELRLWMRQCPEDTDFPCSNILGTFYQDTRIAYDYTAVADLPMVQRFRLSGAEQDAFERFFFGFTGAAGAEALDATISQFQLSFIRPGDPVIDCDKNNWPLEDSPPLPDCTPGF